MSARLWLSSLPSSDAAFAPLQRAERLSPEEDWPVLAQAHRQAVLDAAWGADLAALEERAEGLRAFAARQAERDDDGSFTSAVHSADLEALGYALGVTAVRFAIRVHDHAGDMGVAA